MSRTLRPPMPPASREACLSARDWAEVYISRGLSPLPSRTDDKCPCVKYAHRWTDHPSLDLFDKFPTSNIQVMAGHHWRLLVIDLDGAEAIAWWERIPSYKPRTWTVLSGSGKGLHLWYRLPAEHSTPLPKAVLWKGDGRHKAAERLCDRSLVMAPPSIHPVTLRPYRWASKALSPFGLGLPAEVPAWVLALPPIIEAPVSVPMGKPAERRTVTHVGQYNVADVLASIPDKIALARTWGVRFTGYRTLEGWAECHAIDREDKNPSAAVQEEAGVYVDRGSGLKLNYLKLAVACGVYASVRDAIVDLGQAYQARQLGVAS